MFLTKDGYRIRLPRWRVRRMLLRKRQAGNYKSDYSGAPVNNASTVAADCIPAIVANARCIDRIGSSSGNAAPVNVFSAIDKGIPYRIFTRGGGKEQTLLLVTKKATDHEFGELSGELPPTTNRNSPEYIRWVQQSLNKILGLKLTEDGIMGTMTRSAIRSFQQNQGLAADGIVGSKTEEAISGVSIPPQVVPPYSTPPSLNPPTEQSIKQTIYGWSQYKRRVEELPPDQLATLKDIGDSIIASYKPRGRPVNEVQISGHADYDTPRNLQREQDYSNERAQQVERWLKSYVGTTIATKIIWTVQGFGAKQLMAPPTTEENRRKNRRVEIVLQIANYSNQNNCSTPLANNQAFTMWVQQALNQALKISIPTQGIFNTSTQNILRKYQLKKDLVVNGKIDYQTFNALQNDCTIDPPCYPFPCKYSNCQNPGDWINNLPKDGDPTTNPIVVKQIIDNIRSNRYKITSRHLISSPPGIMYTANGELKYSKDPAQKTLASNYLTWLSKKPWRNGKPTDKRTKILLNLFEDIFEGEGDPSAVNTYDNAVLSWGLGFAGGSGGSLNILLKNLFKRSQAAENAFLYNGIYLTSDNRLLVVDTDKGCIVEDQKKSPGNANARLIIRKNPQLACLFINVAQGVDFVDNQCIEHVRQAVIDAYFETFKIIPTGQIPQLIIETWCTEPEGGQAWNKGRQAIAAAGHNIHAGGGAYSWNIFTRLKKKTIEGVVATIGLTSGKRGINGSIWVHPHVTQCRVLMWSKPSGKTALNGPYVIMGKDNDRSKDIIWYPPKDFGNLAWRKDYIYFRVLVCGTQFTNVGLPCGKQCDPNAFAWELSAKLAHPEFSIWEAYYLVPKQWADIE